MRCVILLLVLISSKCFAEIEESKNSTFLLNYSIFNEKIKTYRDSTLKDENKSTLWLTVGNIAYGDFSYERLLRANRVCRYSLSIGFSYYENKLYSPISFNLIFPTGGKTDLRLNFQAAIQFSITPYPSHFSDRISYVNEPVPGYFGPAIMRWSIVYAPGVMFRLALSEKFNLSMGININCRNYYLDYRDADGKLLKDWSVVPFPKIGFGFKL